MYTKLVKNVTLSADERAIDRARERAREENSTLNEQFRKWLDDYGGRSRYADDFEALMRRLSYVRTGKPKFTRDEMNERR